MAFRYFVTGGYKGDKEKYGKRITPYFSTYLRALTYIQCYRVFSESLSEGKIEKNKRHESIRQRAKSFL